MLLLGLVGLDRRSGADAGPDHLKCCIWMHRCRPRKCVSVYRYNTQSIQLFLQYVVLSPQMDALDRKIIAALTEDGRMPYSRIAENCAVATTTVHQRVRRLIDKGIIIGTRVRVDWEAVGLPVTAVVSLETPSSEPLADIAEELRSIPFVQNCFAVTGEFDLLMTVRARSSEHLGQLLEEIRGYAPGRSRTLIVLSTYFEGRVPPV